MAYFTSKPKPAQKTILTVTPSGNLWTWRTGSQPAIDLYPSAIDAADAAARLAVAQPNMAVSMPDDVRDTLIARWQQEGIAMAKAGNNECWNAYQRQGYDAARCESAGQRVFGWPAEFVSGERCGSCGSTSVTGRKCKDCGYEW